MKVWASYSTQNRCTQVAQSAGPDFGHDFAPFLAREASERNNEVFLHFWTLDFVRSWYDGGLASGPPIRSDARHKWLK